MTPGVNRAVFVWLLVAGVGAAALAALALLSAGPDAAGPGMLAALGAAACLVALGLWAAALRLRDHVEGLERLRGDLIIATSRDDAMPPRWSRPSEDEVGRFGQTVAQLIERQRLRRAAPDDRLAAVVAAAAEGLLVVTESGLVSLANGAALFALGHDRVAVGTSIYDLFHRSALAEATNRARAAGQPVTAELATTDGRTMALRVADLGEAGGVVISVPSAPGQAAVGLDHDLALHEQPPPSSPITPETALAELSVVVLDTETTGVDVATDRIVSIGAVRLHGKRIFRHLTLDRLVDPGQPIAARSTAIHGISTAMVAGAPGVAEVLPEVTAFLSGSLVVGHCIGFDLKMLEREAGRAGLDWAPPPTLCVMRIAGGLFSETDELSLDALAERLGVDGRGRHTALGDALITAEIYVRLLALLEDAGIATLGEALALAERPRRIIAQQHQAGW